MTTDAIQPFRIGLNPAPMSTQPGSGPSLEAPDTEAVDALESREGLRLLILRALLERMYGVGVKVGESKADDGSESGAEPVGQGRMRLQYQARQTVSVSFSAELRNEAGQVRQVRMELNLSVSVDIQLQVDVEMTDPLVIQLGDQPLELAEDRYRFDLDLDGVLDRLPGLGAGAAYLVLDANGNGRVDDGRELFGPRLGNGFRELSALDENGDGRVDAADGVFTRLQLWRPGEALRDLQSVGIRALSLKAEDVGRTLYRADKITGLVREQSLLEGVQGRLLEVDLVV